MVQDLTDALFLLTLQIETHLQTLRHGNVRGRLSLTPYLTPIHSYHVDLDTKRIGSIRHQSGYYRLYYTSDTANSFP